jgi:hypothetical protein
MGSGSVRSEGTLELLAGLYESRALPPASSG